MSETQQSENSSSQPIREQTIFEGLVQQLENTDTANETEMSNMFTGLFRQINTMVNTGTDSNQFITAMFGEERGNEINQKVEIMEFFKSTLLTNTFNDTIAITKRKFNLSDDYECDILLKVKFESVIKAEVPNID